MSFLFDRYNLQPLWMLLVILAFTGTVLYQVFKIDSQIEFIPAQYEEVINAIGLEGDILLQSYYMSQYIIHGDELFLLVFREFSDKNLVREQKFIDLATEQQRPLAVEIKNLNERYIVLCESKLVPLVEGGLTAQAMNAANSGEILVVFDSLLSKAREFGEAKHVESQENIYFAYNKYRSFVLLSVFILMLILMTGYMIIFYYKDMVIRENILFKLILSTTKNAVVTTDANGIINYFNRVAERIFFIPRRDVLGRQFDAVFTGQIGVGWIPLRFSLVEYVQSCACSRSLELRFKDQEGRELILNADCLPFESEAEQPLGYLFIARDVTENKLLEKKLKELAQRDGLTLLYNHSYLKYKLEVELDKAKRNNNVLSFMLLDFDNFKAYNDRFGHLAGDNLLKLFSTMIQEMIRCDDIVARYGGDEFAIILNNYDVDKALEVGERIRMGVLDLPSKEHISKGLVTVSIGVASFPNDGNDVDELINRADEALYNAKRNRKNKVELYFSAFKDLQKELKSEASILATVKTFISIINAKDRYTYGHSEKVMEYSEMIALRLGIKGRELSDLKLAAFLHDIGKIDIPPEILNKKGSLSLDEWDMIKEHPAVGAKLLKECKSLNRISKITLYHHEYYNGMGYPKGLVGTNIPLGSRIIAVADSFDAMTTERCYKKGISNEEALVELEKGAGEQYDPIIVDVFIQIMRDGDMEKVGEGL